MNTYNTLLEGIENAVSLYPNHPALVLPEKTYTYQEMYTSAKEQALFLLANVKRESFKRIAIFSYRTATAYRGTLVALMTGAAFVPLNPKFPTERNISILEQSQPDVIIVDRNSLKELIKISEKMDLSSLIFSPDAENDFFKNTDLNLISSQHFESSNSQLDNPLPRVSADKDAYILFTSGSTGQPKGVPITHRNVCRFLNYNQRRYSITPQDRLSQTFDQTFDLSVFDIFMTWCHGACLYGMRPIDLLSPSKYINENKISIWFSVPSIISLLNKQGFLNKNSFPSLRLSLFCGEPLLKDQMQAWSDAAPNSICENLYGPTELTIACSAYQWKRNEENIVHNEIVSIGKLYDHLECILIDEHGNRVNGEGELCVAGEQKFEDYLNSDQTHPSYFVYLNAQDGKQKIYYKTGDRVKISSTGDMLYLGRTDQQVKINGYRVEIGEIESAFSKIDGIDRALVFCLEDAAQQKKLAAYVIGNISSDEVLQKAKTLLPSYMIPTKIKIEKNLPLNPNGKVDRKFIKSQFYQGLI